MAVTLFALSQTPGRAQEKLTDSLGNIKADFESRPDFNPSDTTYIKNLYELARAYIYQNKDSVLHMANRALELSDAIGYDKGKAGAQLALASYHLFNGNFDTGFEFADKAYQLSATAGADSIHLTVINLMGLGYYAKKDFPKTYLLYQEGFQKAEAQSNQQMQLAFNMNLATTFSIIKDYEQALTYYDKCLDILKSSDDRLQKAQVESNLGYLYWKKNEFEKGKKYTYAAIPVFQENRFGAWESFACITLGGIAIQEKNFEEALKHYSKAMELLENMSDQKRETDVYLGLAEAYLLNGEVAQAEDYAIKAHSLAKAITYFEGQIQVSDLLYRINRMMDRSEIAIEHLEAAQRLSDSIMVEDNATKLLMLQAQSNFENEQQLAEIENDKVLERQRAITLTSLVLLLALTAIILLIRKNIREQKAANRKLQELNAAKDRVFSIIGHDLKSPIGTLQELLELYNDSSLSDEQIAAVFPRLKANVDHSSFTLNNLLFWAKSQMNGIQPVPVQVPIKSAAFEVCALFNEAISKKRLVMSCTFDPSTRIRMDEEHLNIILRNLISNAIKYSMEGGEIKFGSTTTSQGTEVWIRDEGVGMDQVKIATLFEGNPTDSTPGTAQEKGTGLGLAICDELIRLNGGSLTVESQRGSGSRFRFVIP
ncbi:ATP-binding protein [Flagellimonas sp. DF-77]|uniref:tetratricopeptide repeat-containing sensor histidine kinase n=1 Tax=Flagellimonas algarum TaxID=3230298 RepID=UPI00339905A2